MSEFLIPSFSSYLCSINYKSPVLQQQNQLWSLTLMFICLHFPILTAISIRRSVCTEVIGGWTDMDSQLDRLYNCI